MPAGAIAAGQAAPSAPATASSPPCVRCDHRRDEHVDLVTGRRGSCKGQDFDFPTLTPTPCRCAAYVHAHRND